MKQHNRPRRRSCADIQDQSYTPLASRVSRAALKRLGEACEGGCIPIERLESRLLLSSWANLSASGTGPANGATVMLLSDGSVMVNPVLANTSSNNNPTTNWFRLTPDSSGDYANGAWSTLASMNEARLFFTTAMLPDGRVFAVGGEYPSFSRTSEIFDPLGGTPGQGSWTFTATVPTADSKFGDDPIMVLPNGKILAGYYAADNSGPTTTYPTYLYDPATDTWAKTAGGKLHSDQSDEETWVKLPDNSILSYDVFGSVSSGKFQAQRYVPSLDKWVDASNVSATNPPSILSGAAQGSELGPAFLMPNGNVIYFGANGNTAIYNPTTDIWTAGPAEPQKALTITANATSTSYSVTAGGTQTFLVGTDDPGVMLPNGHILIALSPLGPLTPANNYSFPKATYIYEFDPLAPAATAFTEVTPSGLGSMNAFQLSMLMLPSGKVLMTSELGGAQIYSPDGGPQDSSRPVITGISDNGDGTYTLTGTQLNGMSEGATYGDDNQMSSNYPILQLRDGSNRVFYARTYNWSSSGVATGVTPETVQFTLPAGKTLSDFTTFTVIANGIASAPAVNGLGATTTVPEYTNSGHSPAVGWVNGQAYLSWRGRDNHLLNIMRLNADGTAVEPHYVSGATVAGSPALATMENQMYVAWTGDDEHLYVSTVSINGNNISVPPPVQLSETSNGSPALASFNGNLYIAWTGQGSSLLNLMQLNPDLTGIEPHYVSGATVAGSPALATAYGRLWVGFTGDTESLYASVVNINGTDINVPPLNPLPETSNDSPALANINGILNIAWSGQGANYPNLMKLNADGSAVEPHMVKGVDFIASGLGLGSNNGGTGIFAWTSTDSAGTISLAFAGTLPPTLGPSIQNGALIVNGGNVNDTISIGKSLSGGVEVIVNGTTTDYTLGQFSSVIVYTSPLVNTVNVLATLAGLPVTIDTGSGTNTINVTPGSHNLNDLAGALTINGGIGGNTTVNIDDAADPAAETYTLTRSTFASAISAGITFLNVSGLGLKGGSGADAYSITGVAAANPLGVNVGSGTATISIVSTGNPPTSILAPVTITGTTGSTRLLVDDQNDPSSFGLVTVSTAAGGGSIQGLVPATVSYDAGAHINAVSLLTSHGGNNTIFVVATGVPTSINTNRVTNGIAPNTLNIGSGVSVQTIAGALTLGDPGNTDTIVINASSDAPVPFTLDQFTPAGDTSFGRLTSLAPATISFRLSDTKQMRLATAVSATALSLADRAGTPGAKSLTIQLQPNLTVRNMTLSDGLSATGTTALHLTGNTIAGTSLQGDSGSTLDTNAMGPLTMTNSLNAMVTGNTAASLTLTGATANPVITNNTISGALSISGAGATNVTITGNRMGSLLLLAAADGVIESNDIGWTPAFASAQSTSGGVTTTGAPIALDIEAAFAGPIDHNDIHGATVGVNYMVPAQLITNRIFGNTTGVVMPINNTSGGLGFFTGSGANDIFNNTTGVNLTGRMQLQHIYSNTTGVAGSGILGGSSLDTANLIESNTTGVDFTGTVQFNRIDRNATGILAHTAGIVIHNLIYRNTVAGVRTNGANDVRIYDNTFYATAGNNVQVDGGSSRVELLNNVFQADGGTDVYVADDSRGGFFSDYNDLYSTGSGKIAHFILDFSDILDLQKDVGQFDMHSIGTSSVNPGWAAPRFANLAADDYHIAPLTGVQHASSPTLDAADPLTDLMLPSAYHNLLANPSFDSGVASWAVNIGGGTQSSSPAPFNGGSYFYSGAVGAGFAEQTVNLTAAGFTPLQLDAQNLTVVFGGRVRSATETPADQGKLIVTFLDGLGNALGIADTVPASNAADRWELTGDRLHVPIGARSVKYRFESLRQSGSTDDSYLDGAFLYVLPDTVAPDQGAYGNTDAGELTLSSPHVQLVSPQLYTDWELNQPHTITWTSFGGGGSPVRIDLYQDNGGGASLLTNLTPSTPDTGSFTWIPQNFGLSYGTFGLRVQVSLVNSASATDRSSEAFAIPEHTTTYYVNNGSTVGDQYTSAAGSNRNTGRLPTSPKPLLTAILADYALGAGDTVYIDTGIYEQVASTVLSGNPAIGHGQGVSIVGPTSAGAVAQILVPDSEPVIDINAGNFVTLSHLTLSGGSYGVWVRAGSSNFTGTNLTLTGNTLDGIRLESDSSSNAGLDHVVSANNGRDGISIGGPGVNLSNSIAHDNLNAGIRYDNSGPVAITGNQSFLNKYGLLLSNSTGNTATVGSANLALNLGNIVHDNTWYGINASGAIVVAGNTVHATGAAGAPGIGINLTAGASATQNVVYTSYLGIYSNSGGSAGITNNRVFNSTGTGIYASNSTIATGNVSYSNLVGIEGDTSPTWSNNLIYADSVAGIWLHSGFSANIFNNTVSLTTGDGIRIESSGGNFSFQHVNVRNNIVWTQNGYDLTVTPQAEIGFQSDYNDFFVTGSGQVGLWEAVARPTLQAWRLAAYTDFNSISVDPRFVNPAGADGLIGFAGSADHGSDDDFHEQSLAGSFHGGSLAPVLSDTTGLPTPLVPTLTPDPANSPALDRGDPASSFATEPSPNGGFINLGAFGNTTQASESTIPYVLVLSPNGGETVIEGEIFTVTWRSEVTTGTANIDLMNGATVVQNIATGVPNTGSYSWSVPSSITPGSYTLRISRSSPSASSGFSAASFNIIGPVHTFYVNDATFQAGDFTTAAGDDAINSGLDSAHPKASIRAILQAYNLAPGDLIDVDAGTYTLSNNIVVPANRSGIIIRGFYDAANLTHVALINRNSTNAGSYVFDIQGATNVTLDRLTIVGGDVGVNVADSAGSTGLTLSNSELYGNATDGIYVGSANNGAVISGNLVHNTAAGYRPTGIWVSNAQATISNNTVYGEPFFGIEVISGHNSVISGNTVYNNETGIYADTSTISGNIAHNNNSVGIVVNGGSSATGNTTYNNTGGSPQAGILANGGTVQGNISYGNVHGIYVNGSATVTGNRLYNNTADGALFGVGSIFNSNVVYGNGWGAIIYSPGNSAAQGPSLSNNLVYNNVSGGIQLNGGNHTPITNNTVYQTTGDALDINAYGGGIGSTAVDIRNNIFWVTSGLDIKVDPAAQPSVTADFNDLYATGTGKIGQWQNIAYASLGTWQVTSLLDTNSISADPLFVNIAGGDFHEQSLYGSFHGGSLAPVLDAGTGLPVFPPAALVNDANQSPAIDRGDATFAFANETAPNGGYINLGAYGNTAQASRSPTTYVIVNQPSGGQTWIEGQPYSITWRDAAIGTGLVNIDLMTFSGGNATLQSSIVTGVANNGHYNWAPSGTIPPGGSYLIRVTQQGGASALSPAVFSLAAQVHTYYVNDATVQTGDWTTAPGNDANSGLDAAHPKASITSVLANYNLTSLDTILIDAGTYILAADVTLTSANSGITLEGYNSPTYPTRQAVLSRGNTANSSDILTNGAANVTIEYLTLTGASYGFSSTYQVASNNTVLTHCIITGNQNYGVYLIGGADNFTLSNNQIHDNDGGVSAFYISNMTVTGNTFYNHRLTSLGISSNGGLVSGNQVYNTQNNAAMGVSSSGSGASGLVTVTNNVIHDNTTTGLSLGGDVLATGNTVYNHPSGVIGISVGGGEARGNISYNNYYGMYVTSGLADQNRVYNNTYEGIYVGTGATVSQNQVYSNATGIEGSASPNIINNLIYANTTRGIWITNGVVAQVINNTVYQPAGDAIDILSSEGNFQFQHMQVRDNILWAQAGYDLNLSDDAAIGFTSDYNDLYVTGTGKVARISNRDYPALSDWLYEYGYDAHSISADPKFANIAGPDGILGYSAGVDHGADDNFHLQPASPAIDAGDPALVYVNEPSPNGGRINLGNFGNTTQADPSPATQSVQITSPSNLQKLEAGHQYTLSWQTSGVSANQPVLLMNAGGPGIGSWAADAFSTTSDNTKTVTNTIDTSGVSNPGPQQVYQSYVWPNSSSGLAYQLPVPNGNYTLRLHFMDEVPYIGKPVFNIKVNGVVVQSNYDLFASAGAASKATALSFNVTATGGTGLLVELVSVSGIPVLSALDLTAANPVPVPSPTANLQLSTDSGSTWSTIATNQPLDAYGRGSLLWTPSATTTGPTALFRVSINNTPLTSTSQPFAIYNGGTDYYVNDAFQTGDAITTAIGNNANSGKSPNSPLADIQAVLAQYNPGSGATIHVDTGTYVLVHTITLAAANSGLKIQGPPSASAVINRANTASSANTTFAFAAAANNITLDHLSITGGVIGVFADYGAGALNNVVSNNQIYGNTQDGLFLGSGNTGWLITGNTIHDNSGSSYVATGIDVESTSGTITNNKIFNESQIGIQVFGGAGSTISGNETYADGVGIQASGALTITNNLVHDNSTYGIYVYNGALVTGNTVYRQIASNAAGIYLQGGEARGNTVYYNYNGIATINSTNTLDRNNVYSNTNFGIFLNGSTGSTIENLVYANSAAGIVLTSSSGEQIANNAVYQLVGDALRFTASPNAAVRSNILWVEAGDDLDFTDAASQAGLVSDYNDLYRGPGGSAHVGFWAGAIQDQLANWQTASAKDAGSIGSNPQFLSAKGADQVLGYNAAGAGYNGGTDDNFYLAAGSPAIDHGHTWAGYATDILNQPRSDDPGTTNAGSNNFVPTDAGPLPFSPSGTATGWRAGPGAYWNYTFTGGFVFPFYGTNYTTVSVSVSGLLQFAGPDSPAATNNSDLALLPDARIAALWANLRTDQTGNNIYVDTGVSGQLKFTWVASNAAATAPVNFSIVLFSNGQIRFDYGPGNANLAPTVGISMGDGQHATFLTYDNSANLGNAHSMLLGFQPGFVDMGAYEFQGSSTDTTPPSITATVPPTIHSAGSTSPVSQIGLTFSEPINPIDAAAPSDYQLIGAGPDGLFGTADDVTYALTPVYPPGSTQDTLKINAGPLPAGVYRLTVFGSVTGIHNLSGLLLDGTASGVPGSNYVRTFTVALSPLIITGAGNDTITISADSTNTSVWVNHNPTTDAPDYQRATSGISTFTISDGTGNEKIILDYTSIHDPLPFSGLSITGSGGHDILQLTGTAANDAFSLGASTLSMGAMTPIALNSNIASIQISGNGGPDTLTVSGGSTTISSDLGTGSGNMSVTLAGSAAISFGTGQHLASLIIGANTSAAFVPGVKSALLAAGLAIGGTGAAMGALDLADSDLVLAYATPSPYDSIRLWVQDGTINGRGIFSSTLPVTPAMTIGLVDNALIHQTTWDGQTVSDGTHFNQILTRRSLVGDTNLDGKVNPSDYVNIIAHLGRVGVTYFDGDLNLDGVVSVDDLALVTANLGAGAAFAAGPALPATPASAKPSARSVLKKPAAKRPATKPVHHASVRQSARIRP